MCGIVGYIGQKNASTVLLNSLMRLEYRGYDSAGVAILNRSRIKVFKRAGKLKILRRFLRKRPQEGPLGIAHTRWATHGVPNKRNAHPHWDCQNQIALVHNGIIENYEALKERLIKEGHRFCSQTDTEVLVHLIEKYYSGNLENAVRRALKEAKGAYAIAVICRNEPDKIVGARLGSPLILGLGRGENFFASDIPALLDYTKRIIFLNDGDCAVIGRDGYKITTLGGKEINRAPTQVNWDTSQAQKSGYPHFMLKEIFEQPEAIRKTLLGRISEDKSAIILPELDGIKATLDKIKKIQIISCGTAWHAGLVGKYLLEEYARIPTEVDISSEFRYRKPLLDKETLVIAITQSGETADTLAGVKEAREKSAKVLAICNVVGSSIAREADAVIYTHAGPEIAVASTKAYTAQLSVLYLLAFYLASLKDLLSVNRLKKLLSSLEQSPQLAYAALHDQKLNRVIEHCARRYYHSVGFLYLARSINFPNALEGALKIKEISYIHAEGYGAGEMKHGPIALINDKLPVVCIATQSHVYDKMLSNIQEIKARRGIVISIASVGDKVIEHHSNHVIYVPKTENVLSPVVTVIPLQLLAYRIAVRRGCNVDQPKNLAKSVTVE